MIHLKKDNWSSKEKGGDTCAKILWRGRMQGCEKQTSIVCGRKQVQDEAGKEQCWEFLSSSQKQWQAIEIILKTFWLPWKTRVDCGYL